MEVYFICNNLFENNLSYNNRQDIEQKKMTRPLSIEGEGIAKNIAVLDDFMDVNSIYSSMYASSLASAKYLANRLDKIIIVDEDLNDCKIGTLGSKSLKMVKFMQNHDFNIKLNGGESLEEVGSRMERVVQRILDIEDNKIAVYTHKRALLGYLIRNAQTGYNLDDDLIVEFNDKVIYSEADKDADIVKVTYDRGHNILDIDIIDI